MNSEEQSVAPSAEAADDAASPCASDAAGTGAGTPSSVYDPYLLVDPHDKAAVRRQRELRRAAKRGEVAVAFSDGVGYVRSPEHAGAAPADASDSMPEPSSQPAVHAQGGNASAARPAPKRRPALSRRVAIAVAAVLVAALVGVGGYFGYQQFRPADFSSYAQVGISISGVQDEDFTVTPEQLSQLPCEQVSATGQGKGPQGESKVGDVVAYGPTLNTFLQQYGLSQADFTRITFRCKDGYDVVLARDSLEDEVIMTISLSKNELQPTQWPMRLVIPDESSGQWAYGVLRIEFQR